MKVKFKSIVKEDYVLHWFVKEKIFNRSKIFRQNQIFSNKQSDIVSRPTIWTIEFELIKDWVFDVFCLQINVNEFTAVFIISRLLNRYYLIFNIFIFGFLFLCYRLIFFNNCLVVIILVVNIKMFSPFRKLSVNIHRTCIILLNSGFPILLIDLILLHQN